MILTCPSCTKRFLLDAALLGDGRRVKCGQCSHVWFAEPPPGERKAKPAPRPVPPPAPARPAFTDERPFEGDTDPLAPAADDPPPIRSMRERMPLGAGSNLPAVPGRRIDMAKLRSIGAWVGVTALIVGISGFLVLRRDLVMAVWPASFRLYEMAGLEEIIGAGLSEPGDPRGTKVEVRDVEGINLLFVTGEIANLSGRQRDVPDIQAVAYGADGKELYAWRIVPPVRRLFPNQKTRFESRVPEREGTQAKNIGFRYVQPEAAAPAAP